METRIRSAFEKLLHYFNLDDEIDDFELIHKAIRKDSIFKGTNLLVLIFAIFIASVGLNMNSAAVIIGAMLISPLMGPINGMGYSIATYDFGLFKLALKNFSFAVVASLLTSTAYFLITPISTAHSELLARTSPTIYDVLIAFFGGLAGILAISSKQKGNVIPGVAIATALMPPLCTAGFGLASGQVIYFFGALYLFVINTVFIGISSVVMSQLLKFPIRTIVDASRKKNINHLVSTVIALILIPSIYFGYNLVVKEKFVKNSNLYVDAVRIFEGNYLLRNDINADNKSITLIYGGEALSEEQKSRIRYIAANFSLSNATIVFEQGLSLEGRRSEVEFLKAEINSLNHLLKEKDIQMQKATNSNKDTGAELFEELTVLYPQITAGCYAGTYLYESGDKIPESIVLVLLTVEKKHIISTHDKDKIYRFLSKRLKSEHLKVLYD
jgi:uncharacterized hydrophobic protein (TIGR00271 family)